MSSEEAPSLKLEAVVGFGGKVPKGLMLHPGGRHVVYPLGSTLVVRDLKTNEQVFLRGHDGPVACVAMSRTGRLLASGNSTHMGFKADVIVWDFDEAARQLGESTEAPAAQLHRLTLHKVRVADVAFSRSEEYVATLGGRDDNNLVVWDVATGEAVCGAPAASNESQCVRWFNGRDDMLVSAGSFYVKLWEFDPSARKIRPSDCHLGPLKRVVTCVALDEEDRFAYCGTQTGDVLVVNARNGRYVNTSRKRYTRGVLSMSVFSDRRGTHLLVGTGAGMVGHLLARGDAPIAEVKLAEVSGAVTSISPSPDFAQFFAGTARGNTYLVPVDTLEPRLRSTAHAERVNDICFPAGCSDLFVTASLGDVRVWNARTLQELLRIQVPNLQCHCVAVSPDGRSIVSGWEDGKVRAFAPESGKLLYVITDAHQGSVTAVDMTHDSQFIVTGGTDGRVRKWHITSSRQVMVASLKEHKGPVNYVKVRSDDEECVSASSDGSCIVWDLKRHVRLHAMFASTVFKAVLYHPDHSQLLTCGSDRKVTYWDATDASAIRILDGSESGLNSVDVDDRGASFVTGGDDRLVRVWDYDEGFVRALGAGHSGGITRVRYTPDQKRVFSVGEEGAIFIWDLP